MKHPADVRAKLNAAEAVAGDVARREIERARSEKSGRMWASVMLARDLATCRSILKGKPVMAGRLDGQVLGRALRGQPLPAADSYIRIRDGHLDAASEAGPLLPTTTKGGER